MIDCLRNTMMSKNLTQLLEKSAINVYYDEMHRKIITNQLQKRLVNMFRC